VVLPVDCAHSLLGSSVFFQVCQKASSRRPISETFDVKMDGFARKCRMVAGGHTTEAPETLTCARAASRESVRIVLTMAALNDLEVKAADIQHAHLTAPVSEKMWTRLGREFGSDSGKIAVVVRVLN
jgi:hypothetical protein